MAITHLAPVNTVRGVLPWGVVCKETIDPQNPDRYLTPDGWQTITKRDEAIKVRRGTIGHDCDTVGFEWRAMRNGPLVIDHADQPYSLRCTSRRLINAGGHT